MHFKNEFYDIFNPLGSNLVTIRMKDRSFLVTLEKFDAHAHANTICNSILWHKQLGHSRFTNMKHMSFSDLLLGLFKIHEQSIVCEICQIRKQATFPFSSSNSKVIE